MYESKLIPLNKNLKYIDPNIHAILPTILITRLKFDNIWQVSDTVQEYSSIDQQNRFPKTE